MSLGSGKRSLLSAQAVATAGDYLSKEDEYSRLNAELEARTASLLKDAESVLKHNEKLLADQDDEAKLNKDLSRKSRLAFSGNLMTSYGDARADDDSPHGTSSESRYNPGAYDDDDNALELSHEDYGISLEEQLRARNNQGATSAMLDRSMSAMGPSTSSLPNKVRMGAKSASSTKPPSAQSRKPSSGLRSGNKPPNKSRADFVATPSAAAAETLQTTIARIEKESENNPQSLATIEGENDDIGVANELGSAAVNRFLKAKLRVLQEELDRLSREMNKKDQENFKLQQKLKETEEEKTKLQKSSQNQQNQSEKVKRALDEWKRKAESAETQLCVLKKELDQMKKESNKGGTGKSVTEVRLNRALEEVEKYKSQLSKVSQNSKESSDAERKRMDQLVNENKKLEKQKGELIAGFKKQLKLIDLLKRQRMHIEAAKLLHFTEEEFMKALDLGS